MILAAIAFVVGVFAGHEWHRHHAETEQRQLEADRRRALRQRRTMGPFPLHDEEMSDAG